MTERALHIASVAIEVADVFLQAAGAYRSGETDWSKASETRR